MAEVGFGQPDGDGEEEDEVMDGGGGAVGGLDQLPFGLSHQLGQLILGAAQNFNADNPQFDMNFFAPVFGGDEDFGFNPGDEEMLLLDDSDSDSFAEEEEASQIFISLADSHNIRRLSFHKKVDGVHKLPKVAVGEFPCYEELHRLLEEVELLCKVWKRRQEHPYTAHIAPAGGHALREGEDYYSSDYEYDSDEEEDFDQLPPGGVNETLSKKKYCQSFKLFHQIFDSVKQFEGFQRSVSKMKKYVFGIIFALFLEALPTETRWRMPQELWEKVWKFTQNSYFRYLDSVPLHMDSNFYKAGLRCSASPLVNLEKERLRDLFSSIGNLHMLIFEILYKNPSILQPNPLFELEAGEGAQERLGRGVFRSAIQAASTQFSRLQHLESVVSEAEVASRPNQDLQGRLAAGNFFVQDLQLALRPLPPVVAKIDPPSSVIVSASICSKFALTGRYPIVEGGEEYGLLLVIISAVTGNVTQVIKTGHSYQSHLIEVGACGVRRTGGAGWKNHFCITEDRLSFLTRTVDAASDAVRVWSFPLLPHVSGEAPSVTTGGPPLVQRLGSPINNPSAGQTMPSLRHNAGAVVGHTSSCLLLLLQCPHSPGPLTTLALHAIESGEALLEVPWPGQDLLLLGLAESRALLATNASILFFSLTAGEVISSYPFHQLNTDGGAIEGETWTGTMDCDPASKQFALFTSNLSAFRLLQWEDREMVAPVTTLQGGPLAEAVEGLGVSVRLHQGCLVTNLSRELGTSSEERVAVHELTSFSLSGLARHQLLAMPADPVAAYKADLLLNQVSLRHSDQPWEGHRQLWNPDRRPLIIPATGVVGILLEAGSILKLVDCTIDAQEVARREAEWLQAIEEVAAGGHGPMEEE